jgi:hypothetical protein
MNKLFKLFTLIVWCTCVLSAKAQKIRVNGHVIDSQTNESLHGAVVHRAGFSSFSGTNDFGYFSIGMNAFDTLQVSYLGFEKLKLTGFVSDSTITIYLKPRSTEIEEVRVVSSHLRRSYNGEAFLSSKEMDKIPAVMGEKDVMKSFQTLPGIQGTNEGTTALVVRGGSPDQNLVLLDGIPVYNVNHLFGVFSVFNHDAINSASIYKGYIPPGYGGRLSSVLNITTKEGNNEQVHGCASIGLISSKVLLEGPVVKDKSSFLFSARRTYIDLLTWPFIKMMADGSNVGYQFYDINAKFNHRFNNKHRLFAAVYSGRDKYHSDYSDKGEVEGERYSEEEEDKLFWGNYTGSIRWNWIPNSQTFSNLSISASRYNIENSSCYAMEYHEDEELLTEQNEYSHTSKINDLSIRWNVERLLSDRLILKTGIKGSHYQFTPGSESSLLDGLSNFSSSMFYSFNTPTHTNELDAYFDFNYTLNKSLTAYLGARAVLYETQGTYYPSLEPRLNLSYNINRNNSMEFSYCRTTQSLQLLTSSSLGLPTDLWVPAMPIIKPSTAQQISVSYNSNVMDNFHFTISGYVKKMHNLIEFKEDAAYRYEGKDWYEKVEQGDGHSYGFEFLAEKKAGKWNGWISYTYSRSLRKFPTVNQGLEFPYKYDRPHYLNLVLFYKKNDRKDYGFHWIFASGNRTTLIDENYKLIVDEREYLQYFVGDSHQGEGDNYQQRNGIQLPCYHRLDLSINWHKQKPKYKRTWSLGFYNAYWKKNPWYVEDTSDGFMGICIVPVVPNSSYSIKF